MISIWISGLYPTKTLDMTINAIVWELILYINLNIPRIVDLYELIMLFYRWTSPSGQSMYQLLHLGYCSLFTAHGCARISLLPNQSDQSHKMTMAGSKSGKFQSYQVELNKELIASIDGKCIECI